jgi:hypothetical protein
MTTHPRTALLLTTLLLAGCAGNDRLTIGPDGDGAVAVEAVTQGRAMDPATERSLTSIDRSNWPEMDYVVPVDQIHHGPVLTSLQPEYGRTHRAEGSFPTATEALTPDDNSGAPAELFAGTTWAALDVVLMLPRLFAPGLLAKPSHYDRYHQHVEASLSPEPAPAPTAAEPN